MSKSVAKCFIENLHIISPLCCNICNYSNYSNFIYLPFPIWIIFYILVGNNLFYSVCKYWFENNSESANINGFVGNLAQNKNSRKVFFHERRSKVNIEQNFINKFGTAVSNLAIFCLSNCKVVFEHNEFRTKTKSYIIPGKLNEFMYRKEHDCRREQDNWI